MDWQFINKYVGIPFRLGGRDRTAIDCLGLVAKFLKDQGYEIEISSDCTKEWIEKANFSDWIELVKSYGDPVEIAQLMENDIIYFAWKGEVHAGVYVGFNKYLHINEKSKSHISRFNEAAKKHVIAIMRPKFGEKKILPPAGRTAVQAVATVVGAVVGGFIGLFGGPATAIYFAIIGASIGYQMTNPPPGDTGTGDMAASPKYRFGGLRVTRSNEIPVPLCYGNTRVSGNIIYNKLSDDEKTCYQFIGLSEGEVNSISNLKVNGKNFSDFPGCSYDVYTGTATQEVDSRATECYGLRHIAYIAVTWVASAELPSLPSKVTVELEGLKVETWNGSSWDSEKVYSNNPAACIRDYLIRDKEIGGCGISSTFINDADFGEVYEYCAGSVSNGAGGTENRYELDYVIDTRRSAIDNLTDMLSSFGGYMIITGTTIKIAVKKAATSVQDFDMSNIKKDSFVYSYIPKDNQINRVGVQYVDINQEDTRPIAYVDDFSDQDERGVFEKVFPFFAIKRMSQALRLAWQILYDLKVNPIVCQFETDITAMHLEPGDIFALSHDVSNWTAKQMMALGIEEKENNEYAIQAVSYNSSIYNDAYGSGIMTYDYGSPPNPYAAPSDVENFEVESDGINLYFTWDKPTEKLNANIKIFEIREGWDWATGDVIAIVGSDTIAYQQPIRYSGVRTFFIKAKSEYGKYSDTPGTDSITITAIANQNIVIDDQQWGKPVYNGTADSDAQLIWTTNYNSAYYRRSIGLKTATTWEELELAGKTWDELEDYDWDTPVVATEEAFELEERDTGVTHTSVGVDAIKNITGLSTDLTLEWRYGTSTPLAGAYSAFVAGEYTLRYYQFKVKIQTSDTDNNVFLNNLRVRVDAYDITDKGRNVTVDAAGTNITFSKTFGATPSITATTVGTSAYMPILSNESKTGFTVKLVDKDGTPVGGVINWISRGWWVVED